jgi:transposase-like protein
MENIRKKNRQQYRKLLKISIVEDYIRGKESYATIGRKFNLTRSTIRIIVKELLEESGYYRILESMSKKEDNIEKNHQQEAAKLKEALELAMLKIAGLETMIEIAEEQYGIEIKKKLGVKQSATSKSITPKKD